MLRLFDVKSDVRVLLGPDTLDDLGTLSKELGFTRTLLVSDPGVAGAGHLGHAHKCLNSSGVHVLDFSGFGPDPDADMIAAGAAHAAEAGIDSIVGLGGGSSLDCAKGINFVLTQGRPIREFLGYGNASKPMLPMIGVLTVAGTGSEAQSYAIISDPKSHRKMACGDPKVAFRGVILDSALTLTQPWSVTATAGYDAIAHAVESCVCTKRNPTSEKLSREAWRLLEGHYERVLAVPYDLNARSAMQLGAYYAGMAIELAMLGATHACANPLTARYGTTHGEAIAILLPHVVRWNAGTVASHYGALLREVGRHNSAGNPGEALARRLEQLAVAGGLPTELRNVGASKDDLSALAQEASEQWTGRFNPRPFDAAGAREVYECAF
jgi:alcohol dehydrogenase